MKMQDFIKSKWLWGEFLEIKDDELRKYNKRYTSKRYTSNGSKDIAIVRNEKISKMRKEWKTLREIWEEIWISHERVRQITINN